MRRQRVRGCEGSDETMTLCAHQPASLARFEWCCHLKDPPQRHSAKSSSVRPVQTKKERERDCQNSPFAEKSDDNADDPTTSSPIIARHVARILYLSTLALDEYSSPLVIGCISQTHIDIEVHIDIGSYHTLESLSLQPRCQDAEAIHRVCIRNAFLSDLHFARRKHESFVAKRAISWRNGSVLFS